MTGVRTCRQEREDSGQTTKFIQHSALEQFILNTTQLHHAHLIKEYLPPYLTAVPNWLSDQQQEFQASLVRPLQEERLKQLELKEAAKVAKKAEKTLIKAALAVGKDSEICSISITSPIDNLYP
jgi:hypothetical protein